MSSFSNVGAVSETRDALCIDCEFGDSVAEGSSVHVLSLVVNVSQNRG